jgi:DNA-binding CsgD family transcriptional regulator
MTWLSSLDIERVRRFLEETAVPCDLASFGSVLLPAVQKLVPSLVTCYAQFDPAQGRIVAQETYPGIVPGKDAEEFVGLMAEHPVFQEWTRTGNSQAIRRSDLISRTEWHRRALFQHVYKDWGCEDSMPVGLPAPEGLIACLCSERDADFTDTELELIELVRPHVAQMYRSAEMFTLLGQVSPSEGARSMVLDRSARPLLASQSAWDLLTAYFPGHSALGGVFPPPVQHWLRAQLTRKQRAPELAAPAFPYVTRLPDGAELILRLLPGERTGEQSLLTMEERPVRQPAEVAPELGLTRREVEVLRLVRQGMSSGEIAEALFLSRRTVEKHLENIFCKLGVDNRTAAVTVAFGAREPR